MNEKLRILNGEHHTPLKVATMSRLFNHPPQKEAPGYEE